MTGASDSREAAILDADLSTTYWLGLSTTTPTETGSNISEPTTGAYARVAVTSGSWASAVGGAPSSKANAGEIALASATGDWSGGANMTDFILMSASVTGTMEYTGPLTTPKPVLSGDTARFSAGTLRFLLGDASDTYS